jgi:ribosomal protein L11 methyltransferase
MDEATWLEVSLVVDGELAEAVADVLARYAPTGVVIESTKVITDSGESEGWVVGPLRVAAYLVMDDQIEETRRRVEEALFYLGIIRPLPPAQFTPIVEKDWSEAWKQHYKPIAIGERLMIVPAWMEIDTQGRIPIRIDPGMAFGTGTHPTTQLCLEAIETCFTVTPGPKTVIDLGCGSGILAVAAIKLGARHALGVDIDADAIRSAIKNAETNAVNANLEFGLGSLDEIKAGAFSLQAAPLVLANILAPVLVRLFDQGLGDLVSPAGKLILSGILAEQTEEVAGAARRHGFNQIEILKSGDWVALTVQRPLD